MKWNKKLTDIFAKSAKKQLSTIPQSQHIERIPANRGYRKDLDCIHDSSMEANVHRFYKYLEAKYGKIKVEYEPKGFKFTNNIYNIRYYVPDFKISAGKMVWYVEVKGLWDDSARKKAKLVSTQYSGVKIYYIFPKHYYRIKKYYSHLIPNWE